jgi:hypothetical protein
MFTETFVVFQRHMRILLRNPMWVFFGLTQPVLYLVLFGPLLKKVSGGGLGGNASGSVFVPGLLLVLVAPRSGSTPPGAGRSRPSRPSPWSACWRSASPPPRTRWA